MRGVLLIILAGLVGCEGAKQIAAPANGKVVARSDYEDLDARYKRLKADYQRAGRADVKSLERQVESLRKEAAEAKQRVAALSQENQQLKARLELGPSVSQGAARTANVGTGEDIGGGFRLISMAVKVDAIGNKVIGQIENAAGSSYQVANFTISIYSGSELVGVAHANVSNFSRGETKSFISYAAEATPRSRLKIQFENGL